MRTLIGFYKEEGGQSYVLLAMLSGLLGLLVLVVLVLMT